MRAVTIREPGEPGVLQLADLDDPVAGTDEVSVRVRATALNRADLLQRRGLYPAPPGAPPDIPGLEFAGEVDGRGSGVRTLQPGDRVMGILPGGGYAERVVLHERLCMRVPPGMGWEAAAAVPEAFLTAYDALFRCGSLHAGEAVLILATGSGVGTAAAQLASVAGSRVIGSSRSSAKRLRLASIGVQTVLDPGRGDLADEIRLATGGAGIDLALDLLGAAAWPLYCSVLRERGRLVVIGLMAGARCEMDLSILMRKRLTVRGSILRSRDREDKIALVQEFAQRILPLLASGRISPVIHCTLDLDAAAEAHALMERNENFGKIVLRV